MYVRISSSKNAGGAVGDVALGEDQPEVVGVRGPVVGDDLGHEGDPRRLEELQEGDVVQVAHGVEVAEADAVDVGEAVVHVWGSLVGIWIRAMTRTSFQKSQPQATMMSSATSAPSRLLATSSLSETTITIRASSACTPSTAQ